ARPARGDRAATLRTTPAGSEALLAAGAAALGLRGGADLRAGARAGLEAPLLAPPHLAQRRVDGVDRPGPTRLPRRGRGDGAPTGRCGALAGASRVLPPPHRGGPRRRRLRLDQTDPRDGRAGEERDSELPGRAPTPRVSADAAPAGRASADRGQPL